MSSKRDDLPQSQHFRLEQLAEGVYAAISIAGTGSMCNAGIVDLGERTLVFDTFWTLAAAQDLRAAAESLTGRPVSYVVNSHYNADHVNGNQIFSGATIISTTKTRDLIAERGARFQSWARANLEAEIHADEERMRSERDEARRKEQALDIATTRLLLAELPRLELRLPDLTFERKLVLYGPKRYVELLSLGGGHTASDAFLYLPEERIAFMGDLLFTQNHPSIWQDKPEEWVRILEQVEKLDLATVVSGHGPLGTREDVTLLRQYFVTVLEMVAAVIERGGSADDAAKEPVPVPYAAWEWSRGFEALMRSLYRFRTQAQA